MMFTAAVVLTPGQTFETFHHIPQHCLPNICDDATFEYNILQHCWVQHCVRLATLLRRVAPCWVLKIKLVCMSGRNIAVQT